MKRLIAIGMLIVVGVIPATAETLTPQSTVKSLIDAAHANNLMGVINASDLLLIGNHPRHAITPVDFVTFLQSIDPSLLEYQQIKLGPLPKKTTVRIIKPITYDFDLELRTATKDRQEDYYVVIGIHP